MLCGGGARRMQGRDKPLELWREEPLVAHVLRSMPTGPIVISANRSLKRYQEFNWPVVSDERSSDGPLAGVVAATPHISTPWLFVVAGDTPRLPRDLAHLLLARCTQQGVLAACVATDRIHPLPMLVHRDTLSTLPRYLADGKKSVKGWLEELNRTTVDQAGRPERFININTIEDLAALNAIAQA